MSTHETYAPKYPRPVSGPPPTDNDPPPSFLTRDRALSNLADDLDQFVSDQNRAAPTIDPIILGLLTHLPRTGEEWPEDKRAHWLDLLKGTFKLIYREPEAA